MENIVAVTKSKLMKPSSFEKFVPKLNKTQEEIKTLQIRTIKLGKHPIVKLVKSLDNLLKVVMDQAILCDKRPSKQKYEEAKRMLTGFNEAYKKSIAHINRYL